MRLERVLVPVDCSPASLEAWALALRLAASAGARVEALHVYEPAELIGPLATYGSLPLGPELEECLRAQLAERLGPDAATTIVQGEPGAEVLRLVEERGIDLVVMGTHGREGFSRVVFGSVAERLCGECPVPVILVRGRARPVSTVALPAESGPARLWAERFAAKIGARAVEPPGPCDLIALALPRGGRAPGAAGRVLKRSAVPVLAIPEQ